MSKPKSPHYARKTGTITFKRRIQEGYHNERLNRLHHDIEAVGFTDTRWENDDLYYVAACRKRNAANG